MAAMGRSFSSCLDATRMWRRTERASITHIGLCRDKSAFAIKLILDNHVGDKGRAGVRRDHRLLLAMRFEKVFLASRRLDSVQFDDLLLEQGRLQRARPSGVGERVSAINFASAAPSRKPGKPRPLRRSQPSAAV
jgi:hypothetical protein